MASSSSNLRKNGLDQAIGVVRQRCIVNRWLQLSFLLLNGISAVLLVAVCFLHSLRTAFILAVSVTVIGIFATLLVAWRMRPSAYELAQDLDRQSHLGDRLSTALHFWDTTNPNQIVLLQREDALQRISDVRPDELFPIRWPEKMWRTGLLLAGVLGACAFHAAYGPLAPRLKTEVASSRTIAAVLSPLNQALQSIRTEAKELASLSDAAKPQGDQAGTPKGADVPQAKKNFEGGAIPLPNATGLLDPNGSADMADLGNAAPNALGDGAESGNPAENSENSGSPGNSANQQSSQAGQNGQGGSVAQKAFQALEKLMGSSGAPQDQGIPTSVAPPSSAAPAGLSPKSGQAQSANAQNPAAQGLSSNTDQNSNQSSSTQGKHTGAGNGSQPWQDRNALDPAVGHPNKEHVELQSTGFRGPPGKERSDVGPGNAQTPMQNVSPQAVATVNGGGQDSVPARYRQYMQNYFQRTQKEPPEAEATASQAPQN